MSAAINTDPRADAMRAFISRFSRDTAIPAEGFRRSMRALGADERVIRDCIEARAKNLIGAAQ
jgi:hypothetical protein